jgi:UDP-glucose 4-epimerase
MNNFKDKKILVTGGTGFIGSNLVSKLKGLGAEVEVFSKSLGHDIKNKSHLRKFVKAKFSVIYHLAGYSGPVRSNRQELECFIINTLSTINLCDLITTYSPNTKLVLSGSRLEYGDPLYLPVDEKHPTSPSSAYGLSKLSATQRALGFNIKKGLRVTVFRTSNPYGFHPKRKFEGYNVINHFIDLALQSKTIKIFGNGNQERDYIYIEDLVEAFLLGSSKSADNEIYNLGFGSGIKLREMIKLVVKKTGKGKIEFVKWPQNYQDVETGSYISNISKLKRGLNFTPLVSFEEGIEKTLRKILQSG